MEMLFIDESRTIPPKNQNNNGGFCVLGGIIIPEFLWHKLAYELMTIKQEFKIIGEIKWRNFAPQKSEAKQNPLSHLSPKEKEELRTKIYSLIIKHERIHILSVVIDVNLAYQSFDNNGDELCKDADDFHVKTYLLIAETFQFYLEDMNRLGIIVCDHNDAKRDKQLRDRHHRLFSKHPNLVEGLFIGVSHLSVGIQLADMVAGAISRKFSCQDARFFSQIEGSFRRGPKGEIENYGLIRWPTRRRAGIPVPASIDAVTA